MLPFVFHGVAPIQKHNAEEFLIKISAKVKKEIRAILADNDLPSDSVLFDHTQNKIKAGAEAMRKSSSNKRYSSGDSDSSDEEEDVAAPKVKVKVSENPFSLLVGARRDPERKGQQPTPVAPSGSVGMGMAAGGAEE